MTSIGDMRLQSGRKISEIQIIKINSIAGEYVLIPTYSGWQVQYVSSTGNRRCIAVDCVSEEHARYVCRQDRQDRIRRLQDEIQRLEEML